MKKTVFLSLFVVLIHFAFAQTDSVFPKGEKSQTAHHTGDVWLSHISRADSVFNYNIAFATFEPGAKLDWHVHPTGQQLLITEGVGFYQERNQPVQVVRKHDVVKCQPGVEHWHGATPEGAFAYLAVTGNQPTKWLDRVSDETYKQATVALHDHSAEKQAIMKLSREKWQWMSERNVDTLATLFHDNAVFVHMGATMSREKELDVIKTGGIHYKKTDIQEVSVQIIGNTAILLNKITLLAVVGGNEVTNNFVVTEVYQSQGGAWKLGSMSFTKILY
jgi:4-carboxymuconolactone decarboxylase